MFPVKDVTHFWYTLAVINTEGGAANNKTANYHGKGFIVVFGNLVC